MNRTHEDCRPHDQPEYPDHPKPRDPQDDPWPVDVTGHGGKDAPCQCPPPVEQPPKKPCVRTKPKNKDDCCALILRLLDPHNRDRTISVHKPKQSANVKLGNACCDWPVPDALAPLLALMYRRAEKGLSPRNSFEKGMYGFIEGLDSHRKKVLGVAFDAYEKIPEARRCAFETRFDDWPDDRAIDPAFVSDVLLREIIALGRATVFDKKDGLPSVGATRLWEQPFGTFSDGSVPMLTGPWPWICAINPGADNVKWYRNLQALTPDKLPLTALKPSEFEFSVTCKATADASAPTGLRVDCADKVILPAAGTMGFASCDGGGFYGFTRPSGASACLKIPVCVAGQGVALRGFNFLSLACTVKVVRLDGSFPDMILKADVLGDDDPPTTAASCSVRDVLTFNLPRSIRDGLNDRDVTPGRYLVEVHVPNESHYAPQAGPAPTEFVSNTVLIDIVPPTDIAYQVWADRGDCFEETDGLGSDEPWFVAATGTYQAIGTNVVDTVNHEIFKQEDIDSGDWIGFPAVALFSGKLEVEGCVGIAILGLEVDSDDAAKDQVTEFWDAYNLYWKQALTLFTSGISGGLLGTGIKAAVAGSGVTPSLIAGGIGTLVIAGAGLLWAAWAPADPIAYDLIVYDVVTLFNLTNPGHALPLGDAGNIAGITWSRIPKSIEATSATAAVYQERREYRADDEGSHYGLDCRVVRLP